MASIAACSIVSPIAGLAGASISVKRVKSVKLQSAFLGANRLTVTSPACMARTTCFNQNWLRKDLSVIGFGLIGWLAPSSIPAINGNSLSGLFFSSITRELSHFPSPPALTSDFWLWLLTWHIGLFVVLLLGQVGFKGRADGLFDQE
eukprot:jgi/Mesen1/2777/ME000170S01886